jgi:hypothetical protein
MRRGGKVCVPAGMEKAPAAERSVDFDMRITPVFLLSQGLNRSEK